MEATAPSRADARVVASETVKGSRVTVVATGAARRPSRLRMRVVSRPRRPVSGHWVVSAAAAVAASHTPGGSPFAPTSRALKLPMRAPARCTASAAARLSKRGRVRLTRRAR